MLPLFLTHLHILQLEEYSTVRFLRWWANHPFTIKLSNKKPLVYTAKIRQLVLISHVLLLLTLPLFPIYLLFPFLYIFLSLLILRPYEQTNRQIVIIRNRHLLKHHPHLTTIGITGSYGKTSTKNFLFEILNKHKNTLKTPESYNTLFGIDKTLRFELTDKLYYFLCEMGAYKRGEINEICSMTSPDYAILTAIGSQHLERFKTLSNTTQAKFELIDHTPPENCLVNLDNSYIKNNLRKYPNIKTYSLTTKSANFFVSKYHLSPTGTTFTLNGTDFSSPLFGTSNLMNLTAAISMAILLKVPLQTIKESVKKTSPAPHRLELKKIGKATLIDNAYSSNEEGFKNIMEDLKELPGKKALITPGIVELGNQTAPVHQELGKIASTVFDTIILEGHNNRTDNITVGARSDAPKSASIAKITFLESSNDLYPTIEKLSQTHSWILLENDLPDNY